MRSAAAHHCYSFLSSSFLHLIRFSVGIMASKRISSKSHSLARFVVDEIVGISHTNFRDLPAATSYLVVWEPQGGVGTEWIERFFHENSLEIETAPEDAWKCDLTTWETLDNLLKDNFGKMINEFHERFTIPQPEQLPSEYVFSFRAPSVRRNPKTGKVQYRCAWGNCGDLQDKKDSANKHAYSSEHFSPFHVRLPFGAKHPFFCHSCCTRDGIPMIFTQKSKLLAHIKKHHPEPLLLTLPSHDAAVPSDAEISRLQERLATYNGHFKSKLQEVCSLLDETLFRGALTLDSRLVQCLWVSSNSGRLPKNVLGETEFDVRTGLCLIKLSTAKLQKRPEQFIISVLLHEMIHGTCSSIHTSMLCTIICDPDSCL